MKSMPPTTRAGDVLNNTYQLLKRVEEGEVSETYVAIDLSNKQKVKVELLWPKFALQFQVADRFIGRPKSLMGLEHSNLPRVLSVQSDETGIPFVVQEHFEGETLSRLIDKYPRGVHVGMSLNILLPIVAAVAKVHEQNTVHQRINSDNILIADVGTSQTSKLLQLCTPLMTDETKRDARYDVWSIGVVFFEVLSGERLFRDGEQDIQDLSSKENLSLGKKAPHLPHQICTIIDKCLAQDPEKRPATVDELLLLLLEAQQKLSSDNAQKLLKEPEPDPEPEPEPEPEPAKSTEPLGEADAWPELRMIPESAPPNLDKIVEPEREPYPIGNDQPAPIENDQPAPIENDQPAPIENDQPAPINNDHPAPEAIADSEPVRFKKRPEPGKKVDVKKVDVLAEFGPVPSWPIFATPYAIRVFFKRRMLTEKLAELRAKEDLVTSGADRELHKLGESLYKRRLSDPNLKVLEHHMEEVKRLEVSYQSREQAYGNRDQASEEEIANYQSQLEVADAEAQPLRREEITIKERLDKLQEDVEQAEKHKRIAEGELQALQSDSGDQDSMSKVSELETQYRAKKNEFEETTMEISNVNQELAQVRRQIAIHQTTIRTLNEQIKTVATTKDYGLKVHESALETVKDNVKRELIDLARSALSPRNVALLAGDNQALIAGDAMKAQENEVKKREVCEATLTGYDPNAYKQGWGVLFGLVALIILGMILLILS